MTSIFFDKNTKIHPQMTAKGVGHFTRGDAKSGSVLNYGEGFKWPWKNEHSENYPKNKEKSLKNAALLINWVIGHCYLSKRMNAKTLTKHNCKVHFKTFDQNYLTGIFSNWDCCFRQQIYVDFFAVTSVRGHEPWLHERWHPRLCWVAGELWCKLPPWHLSQSSDCPC